MAVDMDFERQMEEHAAACLRSEDRGFCEWCGPVCLGGAMHNQRKENGDRWGTFPGEVR